jgi:two-component sensor histidine kinase
MRVLESDKPVEVIHRHFRTDGEIRYLHQFGETVRDGKGRPVKVVGTVQDVTEITVARQSLQKNDQLIANSLREKQVMLEEIHHRVKNNMQLISSLMQLQAMKVSDESVKTLFDDSHSRILSMALVHENLYEAEDMASVDFRDYLEKLISNLRNVYPNEGVTIRLETGDISLAIGLAIPLGLIVNELVTNAMRHAFPDGGEGTITVGLRRVEGDGGKEKVQDEVEGDGDGPVGEFLDEIKDGERGEKSVNLTDNDKNTAQTKASGRVSQFELVVQDNGIGYRRRGKDGLGLELVHGLVRQIKGEIVFRNRKGTRVEVGFGA